MQRTGAKPAHTTRPRRRRVRMSTQDHIETAKSDDPVVSIIVVSYNTKEMTLECLR